MTARHCFGLNPPEAAEFTLPTIDASWPSSNFSTYWCANRGDFFFDRNHNYSDPRYPFNGNISANDAPVFIAVSPCHAQDDVVTAALGGIPIAFNAPLGEQWQTYGYPSRESSFTGGMSSCGPFTDQRVSGQGLIYGSPCVWAPTTGGAGMSGGAVLDSGGSLGAVILGNCKPTPQGCGKDAANPTANSLVVGITFDDNDYQQYLSAIQDGLSFPVLAQAAMTNRAFSVGPRATVVSAAVRGTRFRYRLSKAAKVTFTFQHRAIGRRTDRKLNGQPIRSCRPAHHRIPRHLRCFRWVTVGILVRHAKRGENITPFSGRIGRRALAPGRYRVLIQAVDRRRHYSVPAELTFTVKRG